MSFFRCSFLSYTYTTRSEKLKNLLIVKKITSRNMTWFPNTLRLDNMNQNIVEMQYAVRGPLMIRAGELEEELRDGVEKPFKKVTRANIGDAHAMGQCPITFIREVLALVTLPRLMDDPSFNEDVKERACAVLGDCRGGSVGSYSDSPGLEVIRRQVAKYIKRRDGGIPSDWKNITLGNGGSDCIKNIIKLMNYTDDEKKPAVMVPIPQYPLYSATLVEFGMEQIGYYLDEDNAWGLSITELQRSLCEAKETCHPRAIVVINPGNPTGQVLTRQNIEEVIEFAYENRLFILADEVYQDNVYAEDSEFHSFKKVLMEKGEPYSTMELASFMTCSKGYMGECGLRGGYVEVVNLCAEVKAMYMKSITSTLCSTILGQTALYCVVNPPTECDPSYDLFIKEKCNVLNSLKARAKMVEEAFNSMEGFSCNVVQGAMYAFPRFTLPEKALAAAAEVKQPGDVFYAMRLLERTGICVVPGSGFKQKPGTWHFRTTILPQPDELKVMLKTFGEFHAEFLKEYN